MMELKQYKRTSAWELNHEILPNLDHTRFANVKALCEHLDVKADNYTWYGTHKSGKRTMLVDEASLTNIQNIEVLSRDIGG